MPAMYSSIIAPKPEFGFPLISITRTMKLNESSARSGTFSEMTLGSAMTAIPTRSHRGPMSQIIDISQALHPDIAVWPGDTKFRNFWVMRMDRGDSCNVGSVTMSLHTGTHADAPLHFLPHGGAPVDADLAAYIGEALVVDLRGADAVRPEHITAIKEQDARRILFRTDTARQDAWTETLRTSLLKRRRC
jgi:hypothetical protein